MRKTRLALALVLAVELVLPLGALAMDPAADEAPAVSRTAPRGAEKPAAPPMFGQLDADKDGYISVKEAQKSATAKSNFTVLDSDGDGKISVEEWTAGDSE